MASHLRVGSYYLLKLVELKNNETYNGHLVTCDSWMNINLKEVICTAPDGDRFWRLPEVYIRGSTIKYIRVPEEIMDLVKDDIAKGRNLPGRGGRGGIRGRGRGGSSRGSYQKGGRPQPMETTKS